MSEGTRLLALYDYEAEDEDELLLVEGEHYIGLEVLDGDEWWHGTTMDGTQQGIFPCNFVEEAAAEEEEEAPKPVARSRKKKKKAAATEDAAPSGEEKPKEKKKARAPRPKNTLKFAYWAHNMVHLLFFILSITEYFTNCNGILMIIFADLRRRFCLHCVRHVCVGVGDFAVNGCASDGVHLELHSRRRAPRVERDRGRDVLHHLRPPCNPD